MKTEVRELKEKYSDLRRTRVVATGLTEFKDEDLIPQEDSVIALSSGGYIKRLAPDAFRVQKRGGKGLIGSEVAEEDFITHFLNANTHDELLFFTDRGRVFQTRAYEIPAGSRIAKGKAIHNFLELAVNESVNAIVAHGRKTGTAVDEKKFIVMVTKDGLIKKTPIADFGNIRRTGIIAIALKKGDALRWVRISSGHDEIVLATSSGQAIRFKESQIRGMGRSASGVRAIRLKKDDSVAGFDVVKSGRASAEQKLLVVMANGFAKQTPLKQYKVQNRGGSGIKTAKITAKTGKIISSNVIAEETEILALSAKGQVIRTQLGEVRITGRAAQGVRIMNMKSGDRLAGVVVI